MLMGTNDFATPLEILEKIKNLFKQELELEITSKVTSRGGYYAFNNEVLFFLYTEKKDNEEVSKMKKMFKDLGNSKKLNKISGEIVIVRGVKSNSKFADIKTDDFDLLMVRTENIFTEEASFSFEQKSRDKVRVGIKGFCDTRIIVDMDKKDEKQIEKMKNSFKMIKIWPQFVQRLPKTKTTFNNSTSNRITNGTTQDTTPSKVQFATLSLSNDDIHQNREMVFSDRLSLKNDVPIVFESKNQDEKFPCFLIKEKYSDPEVNLYRNMLIPSKRETFGVALIYDGKLRFLVDKITQNLMEFDYIEVNDYNFRVSGERFYKEHLKIFLIDKTDGELDREGKIILECHKARAINHNPKDQSLFVFLTNNKIQNSNIEVANDSTIVISCQKLKKSDGFKIESGEIKSKIKRFYDEFSLIFTLKQT